MAEQRGRGDSVAVPVGEVAPLPRRRRRERQRGASRRSVLLGVVLLGLAGGVYLLARETSAFAVRTVQVEGAPAPLEAEVRSALKPLLGKSLVALDGADAANRVRALPEVASASIDRAFPHTLRVSVRVERAVAVLRQANRAWVVGAGARVLRPLSSRPYPRLPRVWAPETVDVLVGSTLSGRSADAVHVAAILATTRTRLPVRTIGAADGVLTLALASGEEVRLGDSTNLGVKLAVAARILPLAPHARYVDVTVPDRAVAAFNSQAAG